MRQWSFGLSAVSYGKAEWEVFAVICSICQTGCCIRIAWNTVQSPYSTSTGKRVSSSFTVCRMQSPCKVPNRITAELSRNISNSLVKFQFFTFLPHPIPLGWAHSPLPLCFFFLTQWFKMLEGKSNWSLNFQMLNSRLIEITGHNAIYSQWRDVELSLSAFKTCRFVVRESRDQCLFKLTEGTDAP